VAMIEKAKSLYKAYFPYIYELQDIRVAGFVVFGIIVLLISWSGVKAIDTNYKLQKQISELQQQNQVFSLDNSNTQLQNQYYQSNQYLELSARQNLGLAMKGETEVIVPKSVALDYTADLPKSSAKTAAAHTKQPAYQRNFQAWVSFFLHRTDQT
jgi:cell division protein FtsB